jgi:hypothetical protein
MMLELASPQVYHQHQIRRRKCDIVLARANRH